MRIPTLSFALDGHAAAAARAPEQARQEALLLLPTRWMQDRACLLAGLSGVEQAVRYDPQVWAAGDNVSGPVVRARDPLPCLPGHLLHRHLVPGRSPHVDRVVQDTGACRVHASDLFIPKNRPAVCAEVSYWPRTPLA